ncbi:transporter substrate-binding domain-containing protein [Streptomyces albus]|uniref:glutamate ABC transporter substrate-binding protein n=1 Tax=Streptomyces TaxID=1883 RepID=UPI00034E0C16|nr:glutamate ABC transporter substrate-binding protein [Streptomyces sp. HPH0547]EPD95348.1 hypothetical protein HMPREF1486_02135 [Streptomyces sp. HPH0547]
MTAGRDVHTQRSAAGAAGRTPPAPGGRSAPGRRKPRRARPGGSAAVLAAVLALAAGAVAGTGCAAPQPAPHDGRRAGGTGDGRGPEAGRGEGLGSGHGNGNADGTGHAAGRPAAATGPDAGTDSGPDDEPVPEKCADGSDPAESLEPSSASGKAVKRIRKAGKLVVGVDQNSYLWGYRNPVTRRIEGFDIELVKAIARDLLGGDGPDRITYRTIPTDQRIPALRKGDVDMVVRTMTIDCERKKQVAFSTAYFQAGQQLLVPKKNARVKGFDATMRGKRVCYASGSTAQKMMKSHKYAELGARPVVVPNQLDCLVRLQLDEADAIVTDSALAAGQAAQDPSVRLIGKPQTSEPYGVAMNRNDTDLVRRVNKVLEDYREHGWKRAYKRWLSDAMVGTEGKEPAPPDPPDPPDHE